MMVYVKTLWLIHRQQQLVEFHASDIGARVSSLYEII